MRPRRRSSLPFRTPAAALGREQCVCACDSLVIVYVHTYLRTYVGACSHHWQCSVRLAIWCARIRLVRTRLVHGCQSTYVNVASWLPPCLAYHLVSEVAAKRWHASRRTRPWDISCCTPFTCACTYVCTCISAFASSAQFTMCDACTHTCVYLCAQIVVASRKPSRPYVCTYMRTYVRMYVRIHLAGTCVRFDRCAAMLTYVHCIFMYKHVCVCCGHALFASLVYVECLRLRDWSDYHELCVRAYRPRLWC
jgi:hypothetical protein